MQHGRVRGAALLGAGAMGRAHSGRLRHAWPMSSWSAPSTATTPHAALISRPQPSTRSISACRAPLHRPLREGRPGAGQARLLRDADGACDWTRRWPCATPRARPERLLQVGLLVRSVAGYRHVKDIADAGTHGRLLSLADLAVGLLPPAGRAGSQVALQRSDDRADDLRPRFRRAG